jgi:hypothetical protein
MDPIDKPSLSSGNLRNIAIACAAFVLAIIFFFLH